MFYLSLGLEVYFLSSRTEGKRCQFDHIDKMETRKGSQNKNVTKDYTALKSEKVILVLVNDESNLFI